MKSALEIHNHMSALTNNKCKTFAVGMGAVRLLRSLFVKHDISCVRVLDVGANIGIVSEFMSKFADCDVVGVEPFEPALERWIANDSVELIKKAVTANGEPVEMVIDGKQLECGYTCSASVAKKRTHKRQAVKHKADSVRLDVLLQEYDPVFIKMDIEGSEYDVFSSLDAFNKSCSFLFVEFHGPNNNPIVFIKCLLFIIESGFVPDYGFPRNMSVVDKNKISKCGFWREIFFKKAQTKDTNTISYLNNLLQELYSKFSTR